MTTEQKAKIAEKAKKRPGMSGIDSDILDDLVEEMGYRILDFCRRDDIPAPLEQVWVRMVCEIYNATKEQETGDRVISSISEDGSSVSYTDAKVVGGYSAKLIDTVVLNYTIDLLRYRKLRGLR